MINSWMVATGLQQAKVAEREPSLIREFKPKQIYQKKNTAYWESKKKRGSPKSKRAIELFKQGLDIDQICAEVDISRNWTRNTLLNHGLIKKSNRYGVKPIIVRRISGEFVGEYLGVPAAEIATGVSQSLIKKCVNGVKECGKGFTFKYKQDVK